MRRSRACAALLLVLLAAPACGGDGRPGPLEPSSLLPADLAAGAAASPSAYVPPPPPTTVTQPTPAAELDVALDPGGRPYDAPLWPETSVSTRPLATLDIAGGELRVLDGIVLSLHPAEDGAAVDFAGDERLSVDVVWQRSERHRAESVLGVRVSRPDAAPVARWEAFETGYGTDGGLGGITSAAVVRRAQAVPYESWPELDLDSLQDVRLLDLDGRPGDDSLVFANGFGDGGFPMSRGTDSSGRVVAVMVWDTRHPWRLAVPDGTPPPDVTRREAELADCIAGRRPVEVHAERGTKVCT